MEGDSQLDVTDLEIFISIHALRVEGDFSQLANQVFKCDISIHALRVEGDVPDLYIMQRGGWISIHALRVEGDCRRRVSDPACRYFYPRPPGGGRL